MDKRDCLAGKKWDSLVNTCVPSEEGAKPCKGPCTSGGGGVGVDKRPNFENVTPLLIPNGRPKAESRPQPEKPTAPPLADVVQLRAKVPTGPVDSGMPLSPALWIFVALATVGSILAVVLWLFIYRRQTRHNNTSEDAERQQEPLQKTLEPPAEILPPPSERNGQAAWAPSPCPHLYLGAQTGSNWEEGFSACGAPAEHAGTEGGRGLHTCNTMREHRIPLPATELGGTALVTTKTV